MAERSFDDCMKMANAAYKAGDMAEAAAGYAEALRISPRDPVALERHGRASIRSGNKDGAIASFFSLSYTCPGDPAVLERLGRLCHSAGRRDAAADAWRRLLELEPGNRSALDHLARHAYAAGKMVEAASMFHQLLAVAPGDMEARYRLAAALRGAGDLDRALAEVDSVLENTPDDMRALLLRADILRRSAFAEPQPDEPTGRGISTGTMTAPFEMALAASRLVCESEPQEAAHWRALGRLLDRGGHAQSAKAWERARALCPDNAETHLALAESALMRGRAGDATSLLADAIRLDPVNPRALLLNAWLRWGAGEDAVALDDLDRLAAGADEWPRSERDVALPQIAPPPDAVRRTAFLDALIRRLPSLPTIWLELVRARLRAGDIAEVDRLAERATEVLAGSPRARLKLSRILTLAQRHREAVEVLKPIEDEASKLAAIRAVLASGDVADGLPKIDLWRQGVDARSLPEIDIERWHAIASKVRSGASEPESALDLLVDRISALAPDDRVARRGGSVLWAAASLRDGGAERALVSTFDALCDSRGPKIRCVFESLSPDRGADALLAALSVDPTIREEVENLENDALSLWQDELALLPTDMARRIAANYLYLRRSDARILHLWQDRIGIEWGLAGLMAGLGGIVIHVHSMRPRVRQAQKHFGRALARLARFPAIRFVACARACAADYADWLRLPADQVATIYNPVPTLPLSSANLEEERARLGLQDNVPLVGAAFRFVADKQPEQWIEMAALIAARRSDARFVIYGDGPIRTRAMALAESRGLSGRIIFPGHVENLNERLSAVDVFCLTSAAEGLPTVVLEAQAAGTPVIAYNVGGMRETLVDGESGKLTPPGDPQRLAQTVLDVLADAEWCAAAGEIGKAHVESNFAPARIAEDWHRLYASFDK